MLNRLNLAKVLRAGTFQKALEIYHEDLGKYTRTVDSTKNYLIHLNMFLYTYFLLEYNKDLEKMTLYYERLILRESHIHDLIHLGEHMLEDYKNKFAGELKSNDHELIEEALEYINSNYTRKLTLQMVSNRLHISKNYLCHLFKAQTGYKFCEYVNIQRVNRAKELIRENKKTFEYISYDCGFSSQSHFSTTFKKYTGTTPNEFKKKVLS